MWVELYLQENYRFHISNRSKTMVKGELTVGSFNYVDHQVGFATIPFILSENSLELKEEDGRWLVVKWVIRRFV